MSMEPLPAVGARVAVVINRQSVHGIVRYVGEAEFKEGIWVGLELDKPIGKNDGSIQGVRYFTCADKHGIFALPKMLEKIKEEGDVSSAPGRIPGPLRSDRADSSPPSRGDPTTPKTKSSLRANSENSQRPKKSPSSNNLRAQNSTNGSKSPRASPRGSSGRSSKTRQKSGTDSSFNFAMDKQNSYSRQDSREDSPEFSGQASQSLSLGMRVSKTSLKELKAQLADAVEEHDVDRLRDLLVCAAMHDSPELVSEIQQASSVLQYEVQQQMLKEQQYIQQQLMSNQMELTRLLKETGTTHVQAKPDKAQKNELERLKQQVAKIKTFDNQVGEMQKAATTRAKNMNRQLADLRSDSLSILEALEAKLQGGGSASAAMSKVAARGQALQAPALKERGSDDQRKDRKSEPEAEAEEVAYEQTLNPRYVLMGAEDDVADAALKLAQSEWEKYAAQNMLEATNFRTRDLSQASAIMSFIPNTLKRCIRHKLVAFHQWKVLVESPLRSQYSPILSRFDAAVVFADASGFTRLTETLAQQANGAEKIGETLNKFFAPVINLVHKHGGDVIKFSGDALTIIWASSEPAATSALRSDTSGSREDKELAMAAACSFCLEVQEQIPYIGSTDVKGCNLTLHIGVGFGNLALLQLGGLLGRWEYCVAGAALDQIAIAEPLASPGETVLSEEACSLASNFVFEDLPSTADAPPGFKKLLSKSSDTASSATDRLPWWQTDEGTDLEMKLVRRYVPSAVGQAFVSASAQDEQATLEEMRRVSVIFVSISGLDPCKDEPRVSGRGTSTDNAGFTGAKETQLIMRLLQLSVYALEGSVNKFLVDDKGVLLLVVFGLPPLIHFADDPTRAVLCAMRVSDTLRDEGLEGHIGVATGMCWCGVVGAPQRREYTVLGDVVNLSARLMGKAPVNGVIVDAATKEIASRTLQFEDGGELRLKGKSKAVRVFHFTGIKQGVASQKNVLRTPLLSWPAWQTRASLCSALQSLKSQSGVLYINGHTGSGKAELTEELRSWASLNGWTLLEGQNLDPSGTFTMPMLSLQQVFRKLGVAVKRDPFWRHQGQELTSISLGDYVQDYRSSGHTGLYWIMIAMIRLAVGKQYCELLEPWAPLLNLVVTQLAFSPRVIAAMQERNEQHIRHERFSELCTAVLDGFSRFGSNEHGTIVLIQQRRSTGLLQRHDKLEEAVIHAIANLCMRRRSEPLPQARPLVLGIITPSESFKDGQDAQLKAHAMKCASYVEAGDLDAAQTKDYVEHYMNFDVSATSLKRGASRTPDDSSSSPQKLRQTISLGRARMGVPRSTLGDASPIRQDSSKSVTLEVNEDVQARSSRGSDDCLEELGAGDHVVVIKESRLKNRTAVVLEPDWNGMVKVNMDEDDEKGKIKSFKRADIEIAGVLNRKDMIPEFVFEVTGGNLGIIHALLEDLEEQGALAIESGKRVPAAEVKGLRWLRENIALPEFMVGLAFSTFEQLLPAQKQVLKAASSMEADFSLIELGAALPDMDADKLADICEELSLPSARTFRKVGATRNSKVFDRENVRFQFYSRVLRQASGTLVLESQRSIIRQRTVRSRTMNGKRLSRLMSGVDLVATDSEHDSN